MRLGLLLVAAVFAGGVFPTFGAAQAPGDGPAGDAPADGAEGEDGDGAQDDRARELFFEGAQAFDAGQYETALAAFEEAYRISERHLLLYNIGQAQDRLRRDAPALATFRRYRELVPDGPFQEQVMSRIRALEEAISRRDEERAAAEATAEARGRQDILATQPEPRPREQTADTSPGLLGQWWFWTAIGVVVAGAVVIALVAGNERVQPPLIGDNGSVVRTLSWP